MRYVGGKSHLSNWIRDHILKLVPVRERYAEPFVGGGGSFVKLAPYFTATMAADAHLDLILMWRAVAAGWDPPEHVSREQYDSLRQAEPSALRGFVGFGSSFSGKWFGGYVDTVFDKFYNRPTLPYLAAARRSVLKCGSVFGRAARIVHADYTTLSFRPGTVVYCDPPYAGTLGYAGTSVGFDSAKFWRVAATWAAAGAQVFVSESQAPYGWECVARVERKSKLRVAYGEPNSSRMEALWRLAE